MLKICSNCGLELEVYGFKIPVGKGIYCQKCFRELFNKSFSEKYLIYFNLGGVNND